MKYRIEYRPPQNSVYSFVEADYAYGVIDLKHILKNAAYPIECIIKVYADGAGVDVTSKYIKPSRKDD